MFQLYPIRHFIVYLNLIAVACAPLVLAIIFEEVSTLHVWITISSLANKDPNNAKALLFRQVELNWINAPLEDDNDYIGLYLDSQPDGNTLPVSVHRLNGQSSGQIITDYYLPLIDFYNDTVSQTENLQLQLQQQPKPERLYYASSENYRDNSDGQIRTRYSSGGGDYLGSQRFGPKSDGSAISQAKSDSPNLLINECIGYCLAYHSRNKILAQNCLKTNPNWMQESFQFIGTRPLPSLMIPGSHNSGTYPKQLDKTVLHMINKYQMNQDESIFNQLIYGIRHLDLRVGYSKVKQRTEKLWIYHDIFRTETSVNEVFDQVKRFLDLTSHEIVIMDFHRFTVGFQNENIAIQRERHAKLIDLIFKQLGKYIIPSYLGQHAPLNEYVSMGKRLIVGYANRANIIPANQAEQLQTIFGHLQANGDNGLPGSKQQVRDIDAIKQDQDESMNYSSSGYDTRLRFDDSEQAKPEQQVERRSVGTRLFNKLKSLKLISKSFSKRSVDVQIKPDTKLNAPVSNARAAAAAIKVTYSSTWNERGSNDSASEGNGVALDDASSVSRAALFFSPVKHLWPNKDTIDSLAQYMNETTCRKYFGELRSMMVELTPTVFGVIADKYDGNRKLAQQINRPVTDWIRDRWLHCINIVASDFFLGNDLIRLSIYANKMRVVHRNVDLNSYGQCKSFRKIENLLDKSKIPIQFVYHTQQKQQTSSQDSTSYLVPQSSSFRKFNNDNDIITHTSSDGNQILLKPLTSSFSGQAFIPREKRDSFVDNVSDGLSNFFSSFKRLLNL